MANQAYLATKTTITFGTTTWLAHVQGLAWSGIARPSVDMGHMASHTNVAYDTNASNMTTNTAFGSIAWVPGELTDAGELSIDISFDPSQTPPLIEAPAELVTIEFPAVGALSTAKWSASMFATGYEWSGMKEERIEGRLTMKIAGVVTMTAAA